MNRKTYTSGIILILIMTMLLAGETLAQRPLEIEEIRVVAPYEPTISDAFKINFAPVIEDTMAVNLAFDYSIGPRKILTNYQPEPITPARMRGEPLVRLQRGLVKGGYGNYQSPYFEGFYNTLRSNEYALGVHLRHHSSGGEVDTIPHSVFSKNKAHVYGTRFFRNTSLDAGALFQHDAFHYYGFPFYSAETMSAIPPTHVPREFAVDADDIRQQYQLLSSNVGFGTSHNDPSRTGYKTGLEHHWLTDGREASEHNIRLTSSLQRGLGQDPFGLAWEQAFSASLMADYYYNTSPADTIHAGIYSLIPKLISTHNNFTFHIGADLSVEDDNRIYQLRAYPLAGFQIEVLPNSLVAFLDLSGGLERQSFRKLSRENPFVVSSMPLGTNTHISNMDLEFTSSRSVLSGGVRGSLGDVFSFNLSVTNSRIDNHPFFLNQFIINTATDAADAIIFNQPFRQNGFGVIYDDIRILNYRAGFMIRAAENFSMRISGEYNEYILDSQPRAWYMPRIAGSASLRYSMQDKIILTADLFMQDQVYGAMQIGDFLTDPSIQERQLYDFYMDVNVGLEYRYTKRLSAFLNFYNILDESVERWTYYPTQGFNFQGGLTFAF